MCVCGEGGGVAAVLHQGEMTCCMFLQILNYLRSHAHPDMLQKVSGVVQKGQREREPVRKRQEKTWKERDNRKKEC